MWETLRCLLGDEGLTFQEVYDRINYDDEAKAIVQYFIDKGFSSEYFHDYVRN